MILRDRLMLGFGTLFMLTNGIACGSLVSELDRIAKRYSDTQKNGPCEAPRLDSVQPVYANAPNWNDYVKNDGATRYAATGTVCAGTEFGGYNACLHGGELRKAVIANRNSCDGLTAADNLGAFTWHCRTSGGQVQMVTGGLADGRYLSDLIEIDSAMWKSNSVTVSDGCGSGSTVAATWYTNPLTLNTVGASPVSLAGSGTIFLFSTNPATRYQIGADKVGVVVKPGVRLSGNASAANVISALGRRFLWLEGVIDATGDDVALQLGTVTFSVLRGVGANSATSGVTNTGIRLVTTSNNNLLYDVVSANNSNNVIISGSGNRLINIRGFSARTLTGIQLTSSASRNNVITGLIAASSNEWGFSQFQSANNVSLNILAANSAGGTEGIRLRDARDNTMMNVVSINANNSGLSLNQDSDRNTIANAALMHNGNSEIQYLSADNDNNYFTGRWKMASLTCTALGGTSTGLDGACAAVLPSDFTLTTTSAALSFVGVIGSNDTTNNSDTLGQAAYSIGMDWTRFENAYRGWGKTGAGFPSAANTDSCLAGTCYIWDYSLRAADSALRESLPVPAGNDVLYHIWSTPGGTTDCAAIKGAVWQDTVCSRPGYSTASSCTAAAGIWSTNLCSTVFLRSAVEIFNDGSGNDNGLCESDEVCIYTPNPGVYQGHGTLISAGSFSDGKLTGIRLLRYSTNGR